MPLAAVLMLGILLSGPSVDDVRGAVRDVLDDPSIQREYPGERPGSGADPGPSGRRTSRGSPNERDGWERSRNGGGVAWLQTLFWVAVGVGVVLLLLGFVRQVRGFTADAVAPPPRTLADEEGDGRQAHLPDPEALARAGRYDEAVHALLLVALAGLGRRASLASSLTSREAVSQAALEPGAREAANALVGAVEVSLFGGRPVDEAAYRTCADQYRRLAESGAGA